nr:hypothetical protein [uncultured archaeon]AQS34501.1 hypothetical protein [uncultured archaeon]AQS34522.1 hypothetical protein [uncultured archaeon]
MAWRLLAANNRNNNGSLNSNNNLNNNGRFFGIVLSQDITFMKRYKQLYTMLCSKDNIYLAYKKARKHKTLKSCVIEFENNLKENLSQLQRELESESYMPRPLETFILRDPKTRVISKSNFRDRVVHHALCNIIEPIFEKLFIYDSFANRLGKGTQKAIERFENFKREITKNNTKRAYVLKADIKHYFENVDHNILVKLLERKIKDQKLIHLIKIILNNHQTRHLDKGMPLGNLTSQFFANIYLHELDWFVKHQLKARHYIRYVDDFVIIETNIKTLEDHMLRINAFLRENLLLEIHPEKSKFQLLTQGIRFLGLRIYLHHRLLTKMNIRKFKKRLTKICEQYENNEIGYDAIYDFIEGWVAYSKNANTYNLRNRLFHPLEYTFGNEISTKEYNRYLKGSRHSL